MYVVFTNRAQRAWAGSWCSMSSQTSEVENAAYIGLRGFGALFKGIGWINMLEGSLGRTNGPRAMSLDLAWVGGDMVGRKRE